MHQSYKDIKALQAKPSLASLYFKYAPMLDVICATALCLAAGWYGVGFLLNIAANQ